MFLQHATLATPKVLSAKMLTSPNPLENPHSLNISLLASLEATESISYRLSLREIEKLLGKIRLQSFQQQASMSNSTQLLPSTISSTLSGNMVLGRQCPRL
jgi:hypothetical protein